MFRKILLTFFVVILITGGVIGYLYYMDLKKPVSPSIDAIPTNACFIIESRNTQKTWKNFFTTNIIWKDLIATETFRKLNDDFMFLDSIATTNKSLAEVIEKNSLFISLHPSGAESFDYLFVLNVASVLTEQNIEELMKANSGSSAVFGQRYFENTAINELKFGNSKKVLSYTKLNGNFIASFSATVLEDAIKQANGGRSLTLNKAFNKVYATIGSNVDANIYLNHKQFALFANRCFNAQTKITLAPLAQLAEWSAFDVKTKPNAFAFNGFTYASDSAANYMQVFAKQSPQKIEATEIIPDKTAAFIYLGFSNYKGFQADYKTWLKKTKADEAYNSAIDLINVRIGNNIENNLSTWVGNEAVSFMTEPSGNDTSGSNNWYIAIRPVDVDNALFQLTQISLSDIRNTDEDKEEKSGKETKKKKDKAKKRSEDEEDGEKESGDPGDDDKASEDSMMVPEKEPRKFEIRQLKANNVFGTVFGSAFSHVTENYYAAIGNYIVFANSSKSLKELNKAYTSDKVLKKNESYNAFAESLAVEANLFCYANVSRYASHVIEKLDPKCAPDAAAYSDLYKKFEAIAIQLSVKKDLYYSNVFLKHNPAQKKESNSLWEVELDAPVTMKPKIVTNHIDNTKEIIVQDDRNNLYLISNKGEVLWKVKLDEKIESDIYQIDRYKNNKLQYVFNTKNKLYMIDRKGEDCDGFPVELKHPATSPLAVFDYEKNREYRLMLACENNRIYNYTPDGEPVNGWEFTVMPARITAQAQHFIIKEKDYIVAIDDDGNVKLVDRKGKQIIEYTEKLKMNKDRQFYIDIGKDLANTKLVSTDDNGMVQMLYLNDKLETLNLKTFSADHHLEYKDINNDRKREFIFTDKNELNVFDSDKQLMINYKFKNNVTEKPLFFLFPDGYGKIGVVSGPAKEIYLFNSNGSLYDGFPLYGSTPFSIGDINNDDIFNVIVGSADKQIYTYSLPE